MHKLFPSSRWFPKVQKNTPKPTACANSFLISPRCRSMPYLPPHSYENLWGAAPSTIEPTSPTLISKSSKSRNILCDFSLLMSIKVGKTNKHSLFLQNNWEKVWNLIGEPLSLHRVFHSIRFKVNKVGIQRYHIFCIHTRITLLFVSDVPLPYKIYRGR